MATNYFANQKPTDIAIQSEDGGGIIFTDQGKFLFGAKLPEINEQLNEEFYQGNVDINPNTNSSFVGIMNAQSEPIDVDIPSTNQFSLFTPPESIIVEPDPPKDDCANEFNDAATVLLTWENDNVNLGWDPYGANGTGIKNGEIDKAKKYFLDNYWNTNNNNTGPFSIASDAFPNQGDPKLLIKNLPPGLRIMAAQFNYNAKQWWTRILAAIGEDWLGGGIGVPYRLTANLGPNGADSYEYLLKDGVTKSGKFVYNPYKVPPDPSKEFTLKGDKRIQLFIDQYDQIIDLYNQDKDKFLSSLKDETIRYYTALDGSNTALLNFHKQYVEKAYELALRFKNCPPDNQQQPTIVVPDPNKSTQSTAPTPSPPTSLTAQEVEEGIYEAEFLPASEDKGFQLYDNDYGDDCATAATKALNDIVTAATTVDDVSKSFGGLPPAGLPVDLTTADLTKDINTYIQFSTQAKKDWTNGVINPNVILDLIAIGKATQIKVYLGTARAGHKCKTTSGNLSRHMKGYGVDLGAFYDLTGTIAPANKMITSPAKTAAAVPANFKAIADKFVASAMTLPGSSRSEYGVQRGVLWYFNDPSKGGNHFNHVHYSNNNHYTGWSTKTIPSSFGCNCSQVQKAKLKAENCP